MPGPIEVAGLTISRTPTAHPLLGEGCSIERDGRVLTHMTPIDWDRPTEIPAIAAPGLLPPGAGGAILNVIAERAAAAGVPSLRYGGPYPTPALYRSLLRSFRASADEAAFTRDLIERAMTLARDEIAIEFFPAPHRRVSHSHGISELRDGLERTSIDGITYEREGSPARLVGHAAEVWFGDGPIARVAMLDDSGELVDGPHPIPPTTSSVIGTRFPPELVAALAELLDDYVPVPVSKATEVLAQTPIVWADLGARAARRANGRIEIHAAIWERIAPHGLARVVQAIAEALAPVFTATVVDLLQRLPAHRPTP